jgi:hypothetical protein
MKIRDLSRHELILLLSAYRNTAKDYRNLCAAFAEQDYGRDPIHKIDCRCKAAQLGELIDDYELILKGELDG